MANDKRTCSDCQAEMQQIRLIDKSHYGVHTDLEYTLPDAKKGFWTSQFAVHGRTVSLMCPSCGRINLYGVATEK
jgi:hypothetical protein